MSLFCEFVVVSLFLEFCCVSLLCEFVSRVCFASLFCELFVWV